MIRRYGEPINPTAHYRRRPGVYAVLLSGQSLLLTHQASPNPEYQLPGGGIDAGEHPIPALHREVMEETGWRIGPPIRLGTYRRFTYMADYGFWAEKLCTIYVARPMTKSGPPTEAGHTAVWVPVRRAFDLLENQGDRAFLYAALGGSCPR